ncbi:MAG: response regulator [Planctomycetaceae bacterium]
MDVDIVFADADETLRDVYHDYFSRMGFMIESVANKWQCVEKVVSSRPFFLIIDVELLDMAAERSLLSCAEAFQEIPVVIVTGDDLPRQMADQTGIPVSNCFRKPYSFVKLLQCMCDRAARVVVSPRHSSDNIENLVSRFGFSAQQDVELPELSIPGPEQAGVRSSVQAGHLGHGSRPR